MFERFTAEAREVVVRAQVVARDLRHIYIGCEHLLMAMPLEPDSLPGRVLIAAGADSDALRERVLQRVPLGESEITGNMPFTPRAKKALELSLREARRLGVNYIGAEHILLGILRTQDNLACDVLGELGIDLNALRESVEGEVPAPDPVRMSVRQRLGAGRPFVEVTGRSPGEGGIRVEPGEDVQRLMMSAAARALDDGRTQIEIRDVEEALRRRRESGDPPAAATG